MKKASPEASQPESQVIQYREVNAIFGVSPIECSTSQKWAIYFTVLTGPPLVPSKLLSFLDSDASTVHFSHNDTLIITMLISNYRVSKILIDGGNSVNIIYGGALNRMEDTPEAARVMINY